MNKLSDVYFNRLFRKAEFATFLLKYVKHIPSGLTIEVVKDQDGNVKCFVLCTKHYGYEHSYNTGLSEFSDLTDYVGGDRITDTTLAQAVLDYFKENDNEIYDSMIEYGLKLG